MPHQLNHEVRSLLADLGHSGGVSDADIEQALRDAPGIRIRRAKGQPCKPGETSQQTECVPSQGQPTKPQQPAPQPKQAPPQDVGQRVVEHIRKNPHNFVSLKELGETLGVEPQQLHGIVNDLRRQGVLSAAGYEGRHGITPEEQRWLMPDPGGHDLGYVMLKNPVRHAKAKPRYPYKIRLDEAGGVIPEGMALERAKDQDLITLPLDVQGTTCANCLYRRGSSSVFDCVHPKIKQKVSARMCCKLWDRKGTIRAWEEGPQEYDRETDDGDAERS
jgi:hypothetical protein